MMTVPQSSGCKYTKSIKVMLPVTDYEHEELLVTISVGVGFASLQR